MRGDSTDADHAGSGALGLGVCRGIIESHGGEFRVVRTAPGQARFDIELPVIEARQTGPGAAQLSEAIRQLTVLVVEPDNKVQRQLVECSAIAAIAWFPFPAPKKVWTSSSGCVSTW